MSIKNATELAFDDTTSKDPFFSSGQVWVEGELIESKLLRYDIQLPINEALGPFYSSLESPWLHQNLVIWKDGYRENATSTSR